jgi:2-amino-4-hydroxy-6-hydroxymethyldihydropteridine diphosphokinase
MPDLNRAYLGLGSNLGDRRHSLLQALRYIQAQMTIKSVSSIYETEPVGYADQPKFLNAVCCVETELAPRDLLKFVKRVEKQMGRTDSFRNAPRVIDIDILFYNDISLSSDDLHVPHPRLHDRAFVLVPMAEIAPHFVHPVFNLTAEEMLRKTEATGVRKASQAPRL